MVFTKPSWRRKLGVIKSATTLATQRERSEVGQRREATKRKVEITKALQSKAQRNYQVDSKKLADFLNFRTTRKCNEYWQYSKSLQPSFECEKRQKIAKKSRDLQISANIPCHQEVLSLMMVNLGTLALFGRLTGTGRTYKSVRSTRISCQQLLLIWPVVGQFSFDKRKPGRSS